MAAHLRFTRSGARLTAIVSAAAATGVLLTGCQVISPRQTDEMYDAADGVSVDVGGVEVRNLVVVSDAKGGPAVVSAALGNPTDEAATITFAAGQATATATVPAGGTANLSSADTPRVQLPTVAQGPGEMVTLTVSTPKSGASPVLVPVLPPTGYYKDFAPKAAATP